MNRLTLSVVLCAVLSGCAFKPVDFPPPPVLQDPLPGLAIVYILRVPHDSAAVDVSLNNVAVAHLPAETYTAVSLRPGTYSISTIDSSSDKPMASGGSSVFTVSANERRFLYTSVPTTSMDRPGSVSPFAMLSVGHSVIPVPTSSQTHVPATIHLGQRAWYECSELDAQGLMSIGHVVAPDRPLL